MRSSRVAIGGASQGCCTALDAALTHPELLGGVFASFGQVYSATMACAGFNPPERTSLKIFAFHGAGDRCIAVSLAMRTYAALADLGYEDLHVRVEPKLTHCEPSDAESATFAEALRAWGLLPSPVGDAEAPGAGPARRRVRQRKSATRGEWKQRRRMRQSMAGPSASSVDERASSQAVD